jgi:hypothetical protein
MINRLIPAVLLFTILFVSPAAWPSAPPMARSDDDSLVEASCTDRHGSVHRLQDVGISSGKDMARYITVDDGGARKQVPLARIATLTIDESTNGGLLQGTLQRVGSAQAEALRLVVREGGTKSGKALLLSTTDRKATIPLARCKTIAFKVLQI